MQDADLNWSVEKLWKGHCIPYDVCIRTIFPSVYELPPQRHSATRRTASGR